MAETDRPQATIWRVSTACWITKATNTHSEYVILTACPQQQWLRERASMLRYTYTVCLVNSHPHYTLSFFSLSSGTVGLDFTK